MPYVKQDHPERKCDRCGEVFKPTRAWQAFCCDSCRLSYRGASVEYVKQLKADNEVLAAEVRRLREELNTIYEQRGLPSRTLHGRDIMKPFKYDDEDQSAMWKED